MWRIGLLIGVALLGAGDVSALPDWAGTGAHLSATVVLAGTCWRLFGLLGDLIKHNDKLGEALAGLQANCAARAAEGCRVESKPKA
jgi:hypothetical protein